MKPTDQTLMEQLRITERDVSRRLELLYFTEQDAEILRDMKPIIALEVDTLVDEFYARQVAIEEVARLIGDAESLARLKGHMRRYVLSLFDGQYDEEYVQTRLRIGLVHKRIGVSPRLYVSAMRNLRALLAERLTVGPEKACSSCKDSAAALEKIVSFDLTLVFDTYVHSLMSELEQGKAELELYAESLEETVAQRTLELSQLAARDGLTGLINQRSFWEELRREISRSQRRGLVVSLIYFDLDRFKALNDVHGHQEGDRMLVTTAEVLRSVMRSEDIAARYGGDEFCAILPQTPGAEAVHVAGRIAAAFAEKTDGVDVSLSMGISSTGPETFVDADTFVKQADNAMYRAKAEYGNTIRISDSES